MSGTTIIDELVERVEGPQGRTDDLDFNPIDPFIDAQSLYDPALKAKYDAEPKRRLFIPTPDGWKESNAYAVRIELNGIIYIITADNDVMVPESVWAVYENRRQMERLVQRQQQQLRRISTYSNISQVPEYRP